MPDVLKCPFGEEAAFWKSFSVKPVRRRTIRDMVAFRFARGSGPSSAIVFSEAKSSSSVDQARENYEVDIIHTPMPRLALQISLDSSCPATCGGVIVIVCETLCTTVLSKILIILCCDKRISPSVYFLFSIFEQNLSSPIKMNKENLPCRDQDV